MEPKAFAEILGRALTARRPKTRYRVGRNAKVRAANAKRLPDCAMDSLIHRALTASTPLALGRARVYARPERRKDSGFPLVEARNASQ